jgi:hypothetical protein
MYVALFFNIACRNRWNCHLSKQSACKTRVTASFRERRLFVFITRLVRWVPVGIVSVSRVQPRVSKIGIVAICRVVDTDGIRAGRVVVPPQGPFVRPRIRGAERTRQFMDFAGVAEGRSVHFGQGDVIEVIARFEVAGKGWGIRVPRVASLVVGRVSLMIVRVDLGIDDVLRVIGQIDVVRFVVRSRKSVRTEGRDCDQKEWDLEFAHVILLVRCGHPARSER